MLYSVVLHPPILGTGVPAEHAPRSIGDWLAKSLTEYVASSQLCNALVPVETLSGRGIFPV